MTERRPWWHPEVHARRRDRLVMRGRIMAALRHWFVGQGFIEVETGQLQVSPGNEIHLHGFEARAESIDGRAAALYLHTSPEFAMKKLLAAGEDRIVSFARVFRNRERGRLHAPEFTMLEWYRAGETHDAIMADCAAILRVAAEAAGVTRLRHGADSADPGVAPEHLTMQDAFRRFAGIDLLATVSADGRHGDGAALARQARAAGIRISDDDGWADVFSKVLLERVEPRIGRGRATILAAYPAPEAALARPNPDDPRVADRFELYAAGLELANCFGELLDPDEQRRRFMADMQTKRRLYGAAYPIDEDLLSALPLIAARGPASGGALGIDRLVMLVTGAETIADVLWTPAPDPFKDGA
jgi:lysyl-tRNA synthetase class 2